MRIFSWGRVHTFKSRHLATVSRDKRTFNWGLGTAVTALATGYLDDDTTTAANWYPAVCLKVIIEASQVICSSQRS